MLQNCEPYDYPTRSAGPRRDDSVADDQRHKPALRGIGGDRQ